jgi:hypothetical protein
MRDQIARIAGRLPPWLWLVGLATALRLVNLGAENLWYDECFTMIAARQSPASLWLAILGDVHPPLWYGLEWLMVHLFGASEFILRLPAALLGILAVYLMWRLALHMTFDRRLAFTAGLILCLLPSALYYSQEARMYALLLVCTLWAVDSALRNRYIQFALAGIGLVYAHNVGVLYVLILGSSWLLYRLWFWRGMGKLHAPGRPIFRAVSFWRTAWLKPGLALLAIVLAWLPWAAIGLIPQLHMVQGSYWLPPLTPGDAVYPWLAVWMGVRTADALQIPLYTGGLLAIGVGLIASWNWLRWTPGGWLLLAAALGIPLADALISLAWRNIYEYRTLQPVVALLAIPVAYALVHVRSPGGWMLRLVFAASLAIGVIAHYFPDDDRGRVSTEHWLEPVQAGWQTGDVLYHLAVDSAIGADFYMRGKASFIFPEAGDLAQSLTDQTKLALGLLPRTMEQLQAAGYRRVWVLFDDGPMSSRAEIDEWKRLILAYPNHLIALSDPANGLATSYIYLFLLRPT